MYNDRGYTHFAIIDGSRQKHFVTHTPASPNEVLKINAVQRTDRYIGMRSFSMIYFILLFFSHCYNINLRMHSNNTVQFSMNDKCFPA